MKNLILMAVLLVGITASATSKELNTIVKPNDVEAAYFTEISTFCKLITVGNLNAVKSMIEAGADVNGSSKGMTPLMYAARYNKGEIVKLLIENGANLKARSTTKSSKGYTALKYAKVSKAHDTYKIISEALDAKKKKKK